MKKQWSNPVLNELSLKNTLQDDVIMPRGGDYRCDYCGAATEIINPDQFAEWYNAHQIVCSKNICSS